MSQFLNPLLQGYKIASERKLAVGRVSYMLYLINKKVHRLHGAALRSSLTTLLDQDGHAAYAILCQIRQGHAFEGCNRLTFANLEKAASSYLVGNMGPIRNLYGERKTKSINSRRLFMDFSHLSEEEIIGWVLAEFMAEIGNGKEWPWPDQK